MTNASAPTSVKPKPPVLAEPVKVPLPQHLKEFIHILEILDIDDQDFLELFFKIMKYTQNKPLPNTPSSCIAPFSLLCSHRDKIKRACRQAEAASVNAMRMPG